MLPDVKWKYEGHWHVHGQDDAVWRAGEGGDEGREEERVGLEFGAMVECCRRHGDDDAECTQRDVVNLVCNTPRGVALKRFEKRSIVT
jgi:hypothetical protein